MDLWLMRHGKAEDRSESGKDRDRALTAEGLRRVTEVGRGLAVLDAAIGAIWTSPYRRARQTAEAVARALNFRSRLQATDALAPESDPGEILDELEVSELAGAVLLVGHQPHLGTLLGLLVTGGPAEIPLPKACLAHLETRGNRSGTLRAFLPAALLARLRGPTG